jgi:hypothetical protein
MLRLKLEAFGVPSEGEAPDDDEEGETASDIGLDAVIFTPYGEGRLIEKRTDSYSNGDGGSVTVAMNVIRLGFGATLYRPSPDSTDPLESPASVKAQGTRVGVISIIRFERSFSHLLNLPLFCRWRRRERQAANS